jgi:hypothetical protein
VPDGQHIWKTTNLNTSAGAPAVTWTPAGAGIPDVPVNSIVIDRTAPNNMYAATDIGIFRSTDEGASWTPFSNGLPRIAVFDLAFQEQLAAPSTDRVLRIATHGRGVWEMTVPTPAVQLASVVSRKMHLGAGEFDIDLPLAGSQAVECRSGGSDGDHTLVFTFVRPVTVGSATVTPAPGGTGVAAQPAVIGDGRQVVVDLKNVSNTQTITVVLAAVNDGTSTNNISVPMGILLGDTTGDGAVNSGDATQTRSRSGQLIDAATFRSDVNLDGVVNSGDAFIVRSRSGTTINP